jgi:hypothetical protein
MLQTTTTVLRLPLLALAWCALVFAWSAPAASAQTGTTAANKTQAEPSEKDEAAPPYHEYKGVRIGMTAAEARKKLGNPTDKGDKQDFYVFSDNETAQVFYDAEKKVVAVAAVYLDAGNKIAPAPRAVVGSEIEPKPDGSLYKMVNYPKAGFWVSYSRTAGEAPVISITMQKKQ